VSKDADLVISFGGDGTLLHTANRVAKYKIPVLGINIGRVGYMAELEANELEYLANIIDGNFKVEERMRIDVSVIKKDGSVPTVFTLYAKDGFPFEYEIYNADSSAMDMNTISDGELIID
jgi:NAD kinase